MSTVFTCEKCGELYFSMLRVSTDDGNWKYEDIPCACYDNHPKFMLSRFKEYYKQAHASQKYKFEKSISKEEYNEIVTDDLIKNVPIYDVVNRRYAAFSSLPEALYYKSKDPKNNGRFYEAASVSSRDFLFLCYLFRLTGSGINYIPAKGDDPMGSHGFGNFWVDKLLRKGYYKSARWLEHMPESGFSNNKGYILPQFKGKGGLRRFVQGGSNDLYDFLMVMLEAHAPAPIYKIVEWGNNWLKSEGYDRQNFVLCAFAMDLAEYRPDLVDPTSNVLVGSNAKKCLKLIFPETKGMGRDLDVTNASLQLLCNITGNTSLKYDIEDVACDFIRYIENYQSDAHVKFNNNVRYYNSLTKSRNLTDKI